MSFWERVTWYSLCVGVLALWLSVLMPGAAHSVEGYSSNLRILCVEMPLEDYLGGLEDKFGEVTVATATAAGQLIVTTANPATGTFTISSVNPGGPICEVISGNGWQAREPVVGTRS